MSDSKSSVPEELLDNKTIEILNEEKQLILSDLFGSMSFETQYIYTEMPSDADLSKYSIGELVKLVRNKCFDYEKYKYHYCQLSKSYLQLREDYFVINRRIQSLREFNNNIMAKLKSIEQENILLKAEIGEITRIAVERKESIDILIEKNKNLSGQAGMFYETFKKEKTEIQSKTIQLLNKNKFEHQRELDEERKLTSEKMKEISKLKKQIEKLTSKLHKATQKPPVINTEQHNEQKAQKAKLINDCKDLEIRKNKLIDDCKDLEIEKEDYIEKITELKSGFETLSADFEIQKKLLINEMIHEINQIINVTDCVSEKPSSESIETQTETQTESIETPIQYYYPYPYAYSYYPAEYYPPEYYNYQYAY